MEDKYLIIITGQLAAGKTSYGKKISNKLSIPFFSKDEIKEVLFNSINDKDLEYKEKKKIGASSYAVLYYIIEEQMKSGKSLIAESNFVKESAETIKELLNKYDYKCITIRFDGQLEVLHKRFIEREYSEERHLGLVSNGVFDNFEDFKKASAKASEFKIDDNEILVDTTDFSKVNLESIVEDIQKYINKNT